ncbi:Ribonuclease toxin, BrnT, of type II toxin-antitoxin system [Nitrosomonas eutropha]|uniref:BrnT family toxin n=1 Tax=Nitrosomonas eutropha TaxID=916 RepID=UPI00088E4B97|nr:BrnT family toxin [Nitrosomonas eutropha]SCX19552.1 Ribonuclease toxin, BrnT, of type II toxin-antitoxin system [Nitrosomonas eutropha]
MTKRTHASITLMKIFNWSPDKNQQLIVDRGKSFEEAVFSILNGGLLDDIVHPNNTDYPNQRIFVIQIHDYVYLVPYVESQDEIFLKMIIPSRKFTRIYLGGKI